MDEVIDWDELRTDVVYGPVDRASLDEQLKLMALECKEEFGDALRLIAAEEEGVPESAATLLPNARVHYGQDAVVRVEAPSGPVLYVGSHNEYSNGKVLGLGGLNQGSDSCQCNINFLHTFNVGKHHASSLLTYNTEPGVVGPASWLT